MRIYETQGIILRSIKYSETSIICDIYTRERGLRSFIVSGVRSARKGGAAAIYQPTNIVQLVSYDVDTDKLARIKDISLAHHYKHIHLDIVVSSTAIFMIEIARNAIQEREANVDFYDLLLEWFIRVDEHHVFFALAPHRFMINLSMHLGFGPMNNCNMTDPYFDLLEGSFGSTTGSPYFLDADDSAAFSKILDSAVDETLTLPKIQRDRLLDALIKYFQLHITAFRDIKSLEVLRSIL